MTNQNKKEPDDKNREVPAQSTVIGVIIEDKYYADSSKNEVNVAGDQTASGFQYNYQGAELDKEKM